MKSPGDKILIFYHFQLDSSKDMNLTSLPKTSKPITVKEAIMALPIDLSQGVYHFRFKSEMSETSEKIMAWIDINNFQSKVPLINGAAHIKILKFQEPTQNKEFHLERIKKAGIIRPQHHSHSHHNHHDIHSAPKNIHGHDQPAPRNNGFPQKLPENKIPSKKPSPPPTQVPVVNRPPPPPPPKVTSSPSTGTTLTHIQSQPKEPESFISFDTKAPVQPQSAEAKRQTYLNQFTKEEQDRENERIASLQFEDKLKKWGYTDMKKINNTTTLIATLHTIWPQWQPVSLTDMLTQQKVNSYFKKAVIKVHPDKNRNRDFREKYLSKRIFELLNESRKH